MKGKENRKRDIERGKTKQSNILTARGAKPLDDSISTALTENLIDESDFGAGCTAADGVTVQVGVPTMVFREPQSGVCSHDGQQVIDTETDEMFVVESTSEDIGDV